uniref:Cytochrome P450 n=1 Tax=Megaselia scalaris TaxID=36166 RepID=T1GY74_MEGSC
MPLIDTLLRSNVDGKPLSDQDIEDEVNTFLFAGHDTTSHTLGFFLYNVAKHPEVQEKLYEEIINVFGSIPENTELTTRKLNELKYLEAVIKESMRLYSTTPSEKLFKDPETFKPDRFLANKSEEKELINPFAFTPFSAGPRNCIGQKFALLEMKTIILKTITTYKLSLAYPDKELVLLSGMILKTKDGININFKKRVA